MRNSTFTIRNSSFAAGVNLADWRGYDTPPTGNANCAWIFHIVSKLSDWS